MRAPQVQRRGSLSKIFLIRRAHVLRASLNTVHLVSLICFPTSIHIVRDRFRGLNG
jgi:hypothetical protein